MNTALLPNHNNVDIIAPAGTCDPEDLTQAREFLQNWGVPTTASPELLDDHPFYANTDDVRFTNLMTSLSGSAKVLWALRGGCGTSRMLSKLHQKSLEKEVSPNEISQNRVNTNPEHQPPATTRNLSQDSNQASNLASKKTTILGQKIIPDQKIIIGFSDITALLLYASQMWNWQPIHAPVLRSITKNNISPPVLQHMRELVLNSSTKILQSITYLPSNRSSAAVSDVVPDLVSNLVPEQLSGKITGGNLSLIQRSIGTPWQIQTNNKIVFFEDIHEKPYRVAEMLDHLRHVGCFSQAKAVIFGDFSPGDINTASSDQSLNCIQDHKTKLNLVFSDFANTVHCPVFYGLQCGHIKNNFPIQLNQDASIVKDTKQPPHTFSFQQTISI